MSLDVPGGDGGTVKIDDVVENCIDAFVFN